MEPVKISQYINPVVGFVKYMNFDFEFMTREQLDVLFYANYGEKNPAPIVTKTVSSVPIITEITALAAMTESMYSIKWLKLKNLCKLEYSPIHNYMDKLTENITDEGLNNVTEDLSSTGTRTNTTNRDDTRTDNLSSASTKSETSEVTTNTDDSLYGFNSSTASGTDSSDTLESTLYSGTASVAHTGTQKNVEVTTETTADAKTADNTKVSTITNERVRTSTHEGNIGNLTTQQLMKQEIELWKWNFIQTVLADLNEFLTIPIYLS